MARWILAFLSVAALDARAATFDFSETLTAPLDLTLRTAGIDAQATSSLDFSITASTTLETTTGNASTSTPPEVALELRALSLLSAPFAIRQTRTVQTSPLDPPTELAQEVGGFQWAATVLWGAPVLGYRVVLPGHLRTELFHDGVSFGAQDFPDYQIALAFSWQCVGPSTAPACHLVGDLDGSLFATASGATRDAVALLFEPAYRDAVQLEPLLDTRLEALSSVPSPSAGALWLIASCAILARLAWLRTGSGLRARSPVEGASRRA